MEIIDIIKDIMDYIKSIILRHENLGSNELKEHFLKYFNRIDKMNISVNTKNIIETIQLDIMDIVNQLEVNNNNWELLYKINTEDDEEIYTNIIKQMENIYIHLNNLNFIILVDNVYNIIQDIEMTYEEYEKFKEILDKKVKGSKIVRK